MRADRALFVPLLTLALVCLAPFLEFYAINVYEGLAPGDLAGYAVGAIAVASGLFVLLHALVRPSTTRLSSLVVVFAIACVHYYDVTLALGDAGVANEWQALGWAAVTLVLLTPAAWLGARPAFQLFLLVFSAANLLPPLAASLSADVPDQGPRLSLARAYPLDGNPIWSGEAVRRPNVYWIVPDSYPNREQLRSFYGFDNEPFLASLERRGFYVAADAYANFSDTNLSVPTTLEMEYVFEAGDEYAVSRGRAFALLPGTTNAGLVSAVGGNNRTVGFFRQLGYAYVHFESLYNLTRCRGEEDVCLRGGDTGWSELELNLLALVPYKAWLQLSGTLLPGAVAEKTKPASGTGIPELAAELAALELDRPFFLYAHLPSPHPPFLTDENCRFGPLPLTPRSFARQLQCVNRHLGELLDGIIERDPDAVIVLSGDHGPRMSVDAATPIYALDDRQIRESLGILNAFRLPAECREGLHPTLSPVNSLRVVFACLGGHAPRLLARKHFIIRGGWPDGGKLRPVSLR